MYTHIFTDLFACKQRRPRTPGAASAPTPRMIMIIIIITLTAIIVITMMIIHSAPGALVDKQCRPRGPCVVSLLV